MASSSPSFKSKGTAAAAGGGDTTSLDRMMDVMANTFVTWPMVIIAMIGEYWQSPPIIAFTSNNG
jgi:hypothetical protein